MGRVAVIELQRLAIVADQTNRRLQVAALRRRTPVGNDPLGDAGGLVGVLTDRNAGDQVDELRLAALFRDDRQGVRIPFGEALAPLDLVAFLHQQL